MRHTFLAHKTTLLELIIFFVIFNYAISADAATVYWNGNGADNLASNGANWSEGAAPQNGDDIIFGATSAKDCTWDLNIAIASFSLNTGYTGMVIKD